VYEPGARGKLTAVWMQPTRSRRRLLAPSRANLRAGRQVVVGQLTDAN
jgi:hypothetical protein